MILGILCFLMGVSAFTPYFAIFHNTNFSGISQLVLRGPNWCQVVSNPSYSKWNKQSADVQVVPSRLKWSPVVSNGPEFSQAVPSGPKWFQIVPCSPKKPPVVPNPPKYSQVVSNGPKFPLVVAGFSMWSQVVSSALTSPK